MEADAKAEVAATEGSERLRKRPRFAVDEDGILLLVDHGLPLQCRIMDLSLEGCRMQTRERYPAGLGVRVELTFRVNGIVFRFCGAVRWTDGGNSVGIQFVGVSSRRIGELAEVLGEVEEDLAAKAAREAAEKLAGEEREAAERARVEGDALARMDQGRFAGQSGDMAQAPELEQPDQPAAEGGKRERRAHARHEVHASAKIFLIHTGFNQSGYILDLSVDGCRIRTDERFLLGIYTRVETEFHLKGQPFRLGGVVQAIREGDLVGIRFQDVSDRKREQVEQLVEEMKEIDAIRAKGKPAELGADSGNWGP